MVEFSQFFTFYYLAEYSAGWTKLSAEYSVSVVHYWRRKVLPEYHFLLLHHKYQLCKIDFQARFDSIHRLVNFRNLEANRCSFHESNVLVHYSL